MRLWVVSAILLSLTACIHSYNILMLAPLGSWSEYQLAKALAITLRGVDHQDTLISGFEPHGDSPITEIFVGSSDLEEEHIFDLDIMTCLSMVNELQNKTCHMMYTNDNILEVWKNRNNFNAIIAYSCINEMIAPFLMEYQGAYIGLSTIGIDAEQIIGQGHRLPKSVTPDIMVNFDENMSFFERVTNLQLDLTVNPIFNYRMVSQIQSQLDEYFPGMPSVVDLYRNYSLLLINSHFAVDGVYPLLPNQVEIGTLTARHPQALSKDLQEFVDAAENGIIYFSLGSVAKSTEIPKAQMAMLLEAFSHLPQRVVWKFEADHIEGLPPNVIIRKWLPQQDILGHPKTLLFISHCGNFGTLEAKYHGVPVLGVPIFFDQHRNAARLARKGYGRVLNWNEMSVQSITANIKILINDSSYRKRIKAVSKALQDQKESPKERAVWWIEYAIRHKDAPHMQYAGKNLNFFQYHMIDVWAFLITMMILWISLCYWCIRRCCRKLLGSKSKQE